MNYGLLLFKPTQKLEYYTRKIIICLPQIKNNWGWRDVQLVNAVQAEGLEIKSPEHI